MVIKSLSIVFSLISGIAIGLLLLAISMLFWINDAPRSIPLISSALEDKIDSIPGINATIKDTILAWDHERHRASLRIYDVEINEDDNQFHITIPEVKVTLSFLHLLHGVISPSDIVLIAPEFHVKSTFKPATNSSFQFHQILALLIQKKHYLPNSIVADNMQFYVEEGDKESLWTIRQASINTAYGLQKLSLSSNLIVAKDNRESSLATNTSLFEDGHNLISMDFTNFPSDWVTPYVPVSQFIPGTNATLILSGKGMVEISDNGTIEKAGVSLNDTSGIITSDHFSNPFQFQNLSMSAAINGSHATLSHFQSKMADGSTIGLSGSYTTEGENKGLDMTATVSDFSLKNIATYWPVNFVPNVRHWVTTRISTGIAPKATGHFIIKPQYVKDRSFPKGTIDSTVEFNGGDLTYNDHLPKITQASGIVHFGETGIDIDIHHATTLHSLLESSHLFVPYLPKDITEKKIITVDTSIKGPVGDMIAFIPEKSQHMAMDLNSITGNSVTKIKLSIPLSHTLAPTINDIGFNVHGTLTDIASPSIAYHLPLSQGLFSLDFNGKAVTLSGKAHIDNYDTDLTLTSQIDNGLPTTSEITFSSIIDEGNAGPLDEYVTDGNFKTNATIHFSGKKTDFTTNVDFHNAEINFDELGFSKDADKNMVLSATGVMTPQGVSVTKFNISADDLSATGSFSLGSDLKTIPYVEITSLKSGNNDISLNYSKNNTSQHLLVTGKQLDLSTINYSKLLDKTSSNTALTLSADVSDIRMKNGEHFSHTTTKATCLPNHCTSILFSSILRERDTVTINLETAGNTRNLELRSSNGGALADAFNISTSILGGNLQIDAKDTGNGHFVGKTELSNFTVTKAKLLTRILTLSSLHGILNLLQGQGIFFDKLSAPFTYANNVLTVTDGKALGTSLGMTVAGPIDLRHNTLNLKGTIVPAVYGFNSLIGRVPLVGDALMGGQGQGIIAVNYSVQGNYEDAQTTVNPLSILTPGFLRNLFKVFDAKRP